VEDDIFWAKSFATPKIDSAPLMQTHEAIDASLLERAEGKKGAKSPIG
jgi:hypothetical protein